MRIWLMLCCSAWARPTRLTRLRRPRQDMIALRYVDQDPGDPPYLTRILVTPDFMRMDEGNDDGDFVLLDRRQQKVINVLHGNQLAMVFSPGRVPPKPAGWKPRARRASRRDRHPAFQPHAE
jgi:hypothetical protein